MKITGIRILCAFSVTDAVRLWENNLYSKGACYTAQRRKEEQSDAPVYLDETKLTEQISVRMRVNGEEGWYPLVSWGNHWYESDRQFEVLLGDTEDIEIHVDSLVTGRHLVESVSLKGMPDGKTMRFV